MCRVQKNSISPVCNLLCISKYILAYIGPTLPTVAMIFEGYVGRGHIYVNNFFDFCVGKHCSMSGKQNHNNPLCAAVFIKSTSEDPVHQVNCT